jgi:hypothetical protein
VPTFLRIEGANFSNKRKKLALTSLTSGGRSVGIIRLRTETTDADHSGRVV